MKRPTCQLFHANHPELAGLWMRRQVRAGLLVKYRHSRQRGFFIVAVWPRWRWLTRVVFWAWPRRRLLRNLAIGVAAYATLFWIGAHQ